MKQLLTSGTLLLIILSGCKSISASQQRNPSKALAKSWALNYIKDIDYTDKMKAKPITIGFNPVQNRFYGKDGCNNYFGIIDKLTDTEMKLGEIATTKMACPDMNLQFQFVWLLNATRKYKLDENLLHLLDANEKILLTFSLKK